MKNLVILTVLCLLTGNLKAATYGGGIGTSAQPYLISTPYQLNQIGANPGDWGACFKLMANVNMSVYTGTQYNVIGNFTTKFTGSFDGNNHVIQNLTYSSTTTNFVGLFGDVGNGGQIKNLGIVNVNITGSGYVGGLVGYNYGTITSCYATGSVTGMNEVGGLVGDNYGTITSCYSTGTVTGTGNVGNVGGLVGYNYSGLLTFCYSTCSISGATYGSRVGGLVGQNVSGTITSCYATGSISGSSDDAGGLVGFNSSTITDCYSTGSVSGDYPVGGLAGENDNGGTITSCYSTGMVTGWIYLGGLVGYSSSGTTNACFWDVNTSGQTIGVGWGSQVGVIGNTTADMKILLTFIAAGWDFTNETANGTNDYWRMCVDGVNYPQLNWQSITGDFACPDGVNTEDLRYLAGRWLESDCTSSNNYCGGTDMNASGIVDFLDFAMFAENWLEGVTP